MLILKDLLAIQKMLSDTIDEKLKQFYDDHIKYLPTKEEHFKKMDELMGEVKKMRDEQELHSGQHRNIHDRFERIDKHIRFDSSV